MAKYSPIWSLQHAMTTIEEKKADVSEDELTKVFNELDDDGNGFITPREAKKAYRKLAERFNIPRVSISSIGYSSGCSLAVERGPHVLEIFSPSLSSWWCVLNQVVLRRLIFL